MKTLIYLTLLFGIFHSSLSYRCYSYHRDCDDRYQMRDSCPLGPGGVCLKLKFRHWDIPDFHICSGVCALKQKNGVPVCKHLKKTMEKDGFDILQCETCTEPYCNNSVTNKINVILIPIIMFSSFYVLFK